MSAAMRAARASSATSRFSVSMPVLLPGSTPVPFKCSFSPGGLTVKVLAVLALCLLAACGGDGGLSAERCAALQEDFDHAEGVAQVHIDRGELSFAQDRADEMSRLIDEMEEGDCYG